ncbi:MAG: ATP-binding cassette domain-containing protein, partial [Burkholderiaceae bacterium]
MMQGFFEIDHLTKRFGGLLAVDDVSFSVNQGEIFTIIGPNGAGKTTIFNLISLIYPASAGQIRFLGKDLGHMSP